MPGSWLEAQRRHARFHDGVPQQREKPPTQVLLVGSPTPESAAQRPHARVHDGTPQRR